LATVLRTATLFELHRWTFDAPKGTEHAAIACQWLKHFVTPFALVEEDARVGGHFFFCGESAFWAGDDGAQCYFHGDSNDV
jgi:hypothetical protein